MANHFEEVGNSSYVNLMTAYQLLGIDNLLGVPGMSTCFAEGGIAHDEMVFHVVPGKWSQMELADLLNIALTVITPQVAVQATGC